MGSSNTDPEPRTLIIHVCLTESQKERQVEMVHVLVNTITSKSIGIDGVQHQYPNLTPSTIYIQKVKYTDLINTGVDQNKRRKRDK